MPEVCSVCLCHMHQVVTLAIVGLSGSGWVDTAAIVTSVRNFPRHRGSVVGVSLISNMNMNTTRNRNVAQNL